MPIFPSRPDEMDAAAPSPEQRSLPMYCKTTTSRFRNYKLRIQSPSSGTKTLLSKRDCSEDKASLHGDFLNHHCTNSGVVPNPTYKNHEKHGELKNHFTETTSRMLAIPIALLCSRTLRTGLTIYLPVMNFRQHSH